MRAIITVLGKDRVGIIAGVCTVLSKHNINVLDISQTIVSDFFTMTMVVDVSDSDVEFAVLADLLDAKGKDLGMNIRIQLEDIFDAMHRI